MSAAKSSKFHLSSPPIPGLIHFSLTEVLGAVYLFGGVQGRAFTLPTTPGIDSLYRYDFTTEQWQQFNQKTSPWPGHRFAHTAVSYGTKLIIYGGMSYFNNNTGFYDDCWAFDTRTCCTCFYY